MIRSLRWRLLAGTSLAGIMVLSLLGISVYTAMRHALMRDFDSSLESDARLVAGMIEQDGPKISFEFDPRQMPDFLADDRRRYFEVWADDGSVLARSPSLGNRDLPRIAGAQTIAAIQFPGPHHGRAFAFPFTVTPQEEDEGTQRWAARKVNILVTAEPFEVHRTLELLAWLLTSLCATAVIIMGLVLVRVVGRSLRPVTRLSAEIGALRETDLSRRLSAAGVPGELAPVVDKLNGLLSRLEQAFAREKSFTADVAHELRTPLAGLRSTLEVCRSRRRDASAYETALDDCRGIADRMEAMVQSLLLLARSDAGQVAFERRPVDLGQILWRCWSHFEYRAARRCLNVTFPSPSACVAATDPDKLQIVLQNILDNAVTYADEAGRLCIAIRQDGPAAVIEVANTGSLIATEDTPCLFDRFWRGAAARTDAGLHCGLGLSLSQRLMTLLGGEIHVQTVTGGEFIVRLKLPASPPPE